MPETSAVSQTAPTVTPERILQYAWGYAPPLIMEAALRNGLFDALASAPLSLEQLVAVSGASTRGVQAVMDALVGLGLCARDREGRYVLTPESEAFLVSSRPGYLGGFLRHISDHLIPAWLSLESCVRTGKTARAVNSQEDGAQFFSEFVEGLFPLGYTAALALAKSLGLPGNSQLRVLDIAAGSAVWGIGFAQTYPQARVSAVDWEGVIPVTKRVVARHGLADRFDYIPGDILEVDFGTGYDVATLGQILHSEGDDRSRALLDRVFKALKPGGYICIADFLSNEERTGPPQALIFSVNMLINTKIGRTYSFAELSEWLRAAGFRNPKVLDIPMPSVVVAQKPA